MVAVAGKVEEMRSFLLNEFAPMIQQLKIRPQSISDKGASFEVPDNKFIMRSGDIVCGQAVASIADTVGVLTLIGHNPQPRMLTTIDMTTHFMRPLSKAGLRVDTRILSNGRRLASVFVEVRQKGSEKLAASSTCAYAYLDI